MSPLKTITILLLAIFGSMTSYAQEYQEFESHVSNTSNPTVYGLPSVREINGGSVFKIQYQGNWSPEMKGAFEYACKIVEETLLPCLPITVKAEINNSASSSSALSTVKFIGFKDFSCGIETQTALAPQIKAVVLGEYEAQSYYQYFNKIESVSFFEDFSRPDIRIIYNGNKLGDCSFSLAEISNDKYDFVSIVIRDLLKGLGFASALKANVSTEEILNINDNHTTSFDGYVRGALFGNGSKTPFENATSGELEFYNERVSNGYKRLRLYAPSQWEQGVSLNYFIPSDDYKISKVLRYDFGKGTVTRDLVDPSNKSLFRELLYWTIYTTSATGNIGINQSGTTADFVDYGGNISFCLGQESDQSDNGEDPQPIQLPARVAGPTDPSTIEHITTFCKPFHPFYYGMENELDMDGWTVSVLKKDGKWDCVCFSTWPDPDITFRFSDLTFHCDDNEYARTCEGYLRCRITRSYNKYGGSGNPRTYEARYFVMDYLPQAVELGLSAQGNPLGNNASAMSTTTTVKIGMKNLEGLTRLVLEVKPEGARVPNKIEVSDLTSGVTELQLTTGKTTTITPVSYNANGSVRGEPLTIDLTD